MRSWLEQPVLLLFLSESSSLRREHSASQIWAFFRSPLSVCRVHGGRRGAGHVTCHRRLISGGLVDIKQGKGFTISGLIPLFSARKSEPRMS